MNIMDQRKAEAFAFKVLFQIFRNIWKFPLEWNFKTHSINIPKSLRLYKAYLAIFSVAQFLWLICIINTFLYHSFLPGYPFPRVTKVIVVTIAGGFFVAQIILMIFLLNRRQTVASFNLIIQMESAITAGNLFTIITSFHKSKV